MWAFPHQRVPLNSNNSLLTIPGVIMQGHGVASGVGADARYPNGTLSLQLPLFKALGLDLSKYHRATLNISIRPHIWRMRNPCFTFRRVEWTQHHPPEDFSFSRGAVVFLGNRYDGWVYQPHPETKRDHFHNPSIVEFIAPLIPGITYGSAVEVLLHLDEVTVARSAN